MYWQLFSITVSQKFDDPANVLKFELLGVDGSTAHRKKGMQTIGYFRVFVQFFQIFMQFRRHLVVTRDVVLKKVWERIQKTSHFETASNSF